MHDEKERERRRNIEEGEQKGTKNGEGLSMMKGKRNENGGWDEEEDRR